MELLQSVMKALNDAVVNLDTPPWAEPLSCERESSIIRRSPVISPHLAAMTEAAQNGMIVGDFLSRNIPTPTGTHPLFV